MLAVTLWLASGATVLQAQTTTSARTRQTAAVDTRIARAREIVRNAIATQRVPGMSVAVALDGKVIWAEGFGFADLENRVPMTAQSRVRIASISKSLTSAAVAKLVEEGKLDLDAPIQKYVPSFPQKPWTITARNLGGHLGGIRHYRDGEFESMRAYPSVTAALGVFMNDSLEAQPGTRFIYSTYGFNLLSAVVEGASGEPFVTYMQRRVFEPLGMTSTVAEWADSIIPNRAHYYLRDSVGPMRNAPYVDNSVKWAGGGFLSTATDLVRFGSAFLRPGFLKPETIDLLWRSQKTADGKETGYGIGWSTQTDSAGVRRISHSGGAMGANSLLLIYPQQQLVVATIINTNASAASGTANAIARVFLRR